MKTVLCVEDELKILENNRKAIEDAGYTVLTAANLKQAREHLARQTPGAIILDIILPDGNGLDLLKELRGAGSKIPVLMLTAWGKPSDIARGLKLGANDYISKPFEYEVLLARLETMFRNLEQVPETIIKGPVTLEVFSNKAYLGGENLALTQKDFDLLFLLVQNEDKVLDAGYIYETIWAQPMIGDKNAVQAAISKLRKKLAGSGYDIETVRNKGYVFIKI